MQITQDDLIREIHNANHWRIKYHIARSLSVYFNELYIAGDRAFNVDEEIQFHAKRLISEYNQLIETVTTTEAMRKVLEKWN